MRLFPIILLAITAYVRQCYAFWRPQRKSCDSEYYYTWSAEEKRDFDNRSAVTESGSRKKLKENKGNYTKKEIEDILCQERMEAQKEYHRVLAVRKVNQLSNATRIDEVPLILGDVAVFQKIYLPDQLKSHWNNGSFLVNIDTGSCNLLLPHAACQSCNSTQKYSSLNSKGFKDLNLIFQKTSRRKIITFLSQKLDTIQIFDSIEYDVGHGQKKSTPMTIEMAIYSYDKKYWQGILGLCPQNQQNGDEDWDSSNVAKTHDEARVQHRSTFPYQIGVWSKFSGFQYANVFSINLDVKKPQNSKIVYGGVLDEFKNKPIVYFQNYEKKGRIPKGHYKSDKWTTVIDEVRFGDAKMESKSFFSRRTAPLVQKVLFDTGCTYHQAPKPFVDKLIELAASKIPGFKDAEIIEAVYAKCTEEQYNQIPAITFQVGTDTITLHRHLWARYDAEIGYCALTIATLPSTSSFLDTFVLGYNFFKQYFTVFDNEQNRIGVYDKGTGPQKRWWKFWR